MNTAGHLERHELRLRAQRALQIAPRCDSDQSKHDGNADEQMRIHEFLFVR